MALLPFVAGLMMTAGIILLFRALSMPEEEDTLQTRLNQYGARPPSLEEIELQKPFSERMLKPIVLKLSASLAARTPQKTLEDIRINLDGAGNPNNLTVADFLGIKGFAGLALGGVGFLLLSGSDQSVLVKALAPLGLAFFGQNLPNMWLSGKITARQKELTLSLPDALDLLTISVEAGMGFEQALQKVAEKWDNALTREFARVLREQRMGMSRREALRGLGARAAVPEVVAFTSAIIQADQLGVSISRILQLQSEQMRIKRRQKAEKLAHEAPLKMTFPMVLFMMPALWIVILGPMWPNMAIMMGGGGGGG
ncbi:MAG: type II secretion system F family protein [Chloroflexi bacterium]|nr:type II secretion system F family protein [Chloroflexota bacterium]